MLDSGYRGPTTNDLFREKLQYARILKKIGKDKEDRREKIELQEILKDVYVGLATPIRLIGQLAKISSPFVAFADWKIGLGTYLAGSLSLRFLGDNYLECFTFPEPPSSGWDCSTPVYRASEKLTKGIFYIKHGQIARNEIY